MPSAVVIVPSQGNHVKLFKIVGKALIDEVYADHASKLVQTKVDVVNGKYVVLFQKADGSTFDWSSVANLNSVVMISHGGQHSGPILARDINDSAIQPWGATSGSGAPTLTGEARKFWQRVGKAVRQTVMVPGKIILAGCRMGEGSYAQSVASAAGILVYAANGEFAAADTKTVLKHVRSIETGAAQQPMQLFRK